MKAITLIIFLIFSSSAFAVPSIPSNWMSLEDKEENLNFKANERQQEEFGEYLTSLYDLQEETLEEVTADENKSTPKKSWKFAGYKTDLFLSYSGLLGFTSLSGKSAAELTWSRVAKNNKAMIEDMEEGQLVEIDNTISEKELQKQLEPVIRMAIDSGKVKNESKMRKALMKKALEVHESMSALDQEVGSSWVPFKFRLDLTFGVSGDLFNVVDLGGAFRVRLEWAISKNGKKLEKGLFSIFKKKKEKRIEHFQKLVRHLAVDTEKATEDLEKNSGYKLAAINFGIGMTKKLFFNIAKSKAGATGFLFFKKVKKTAPANKNVDIDGEYVFAEDADNGNNKLFGKVFKRNRFRKGLNKAVKIGEFFAKRAERREAEGKEMKWSLSGIKLTFVLSYSGIFGLSNTSAAGIHNIILKKK